MTPLNRRQLLKKSACGLASLTAGSLTLRASAQATPNSGTIGAYGDYLHGRGESANSTPPSNIPEPKSFTPTEDNILGPFHRDGAPFRGKVAPPLEPGRVLLITGRVWALDTRKPLAGAVIDLWQANDQGHYDNDDPAHPPAKDIFKNRCRVI